MSDSFRPHGLSPARILRPWDSPGKISPFPSLGDLPNPEADSLPLSHLGSHKNISETLYFLPLRFHNDNSNKLRFPKFI